MKFLRIIRRQGLALPVFTLVLASAISTGLIAYRVIASCQIAHAYLVWNLFLAWLPLVFAALAAERFHVANGLRDRRFLALGTAWLLFLPNASYIFTDVVHVLHARPPSFWVELMLILLCAMTGFLAGFLSLQVMHRLATRAWGRAAGWLFVGVVSGLTGFGVYLGRFVRLNSWDVVTSPIELFYCLRSAAWNVLTQGHDLKFFVLFSLFLLLGYVMLYALTLQRQEGATA